MTRTEFNNSEWCKAVGLKPAVLSLYAPGHTAPDIVSVAIPTHEMEVEVAELTPVLVDEVRHC